MLFFFLKISQSKKFQFVLPISGFNTLICYRLFFRFFSTPVMEQRTMIITFKKCLLSDCTPTVYENVKIMILSPIHLFCGDFRLHWVAIALNQSYILKELVNIVYWKKQAIYKLSRKQCIKNKNLIQVLGFVSFRCLVLSYIMII